MSRRSSALALLVIAVVATLLPALAGASAQAATGTVVVKAQGDSYVSEASPKSKYGPSKVLKVSGSPALHTYIRFNVKGVKGTVTQATLTLRPTGDAAVPIDVHLVDGKWKEPDITWANAPDLGAVVGSAPGVSGDRLDIDVTRAVTGDGAVDLGLTVGAGAESSPVVAEFDSREVKNMAPTLTVSYGDADTTAPAAPTGLSATAGDGSVALGWAASTESDLQGYRVYRQATDGSWPLVKEIAAPGTAWTDSGLTNGTTYAYRVTAVDTSGNESVPSAAVPATPTRAQDTTAPAAPTGLGATPGDRSVTLAWRPNTEPDLAGYRVYLQSGDGSWPANPVKELPASMTTWTDSDLTNGTTYGYRVTAVDTGGNESDPSDAVTATPTATPPHDDTPPAAPTGIAATSGDRVAMVTWRANTESDLAWYRVYRRPAGGEWQDTPLTAVSSTSFTDTTVVNGSSYDYRVTAVDTSGNESAPSAFVTASPTSSTPAAPCSATSDYSSAVLGASTLAAYWRLDESTGDTACDARGTSPGRYNGGYTLGARGAIAGDADTAVRLDGSTGYVRVPSTGVLSPAGGLSLEAWVSPASADGRQTVIRKEKQYLIRIVDGALVGRIWFGGSPVQVASGAVVTTGYQHVVMTYDGTTMRMFRNGTQVGSTNVAGTLPTGSNALILGMSPDPAENYDFLGGRLDDVAVYGSALSAATVADHYRLGTSGGSSTDTTPPVAPTGLNAVPGDRTVTLTWQANTETDLGGYRVYRRTTGGVWSSDPLTVVGSSSYTDGGLQNGTSYDYRVTAVDTSGNESGPSGAVTVVPSASASPCGPSSDYSSAVLDTTGLSAYWRLGDTAGTTACDARGTSPGTYHGGYTLGSPGAIAGDPNTAVTLDGSTGYVKVPSTAALNPTTAMTFETWVAPTAVGPRQTLVRKDNQYVLRINNGTLVARLWWSDGTRTDISSGAVLTTGFQHVALTYDGTALRLFRNGTEVATVAAAKTLATGTNAVYLGMSPDPVENYDFLGGRLDEAAMYTTALSTDTLAAHYSLGATVTGAGPARLTGIGGPGSIGLDWSDVPGASEYRIYRRSSDGSWPSASTTVTGTTAYVVRGLTDGQAYAFRVTAMVGGTESAPSPTATATPTDNVLLAAGDIADSTFRSEQTAQLLDHNPGQVLMLGDAAYPDGTAAEYQQYYAPTWGRHLWRTSAVVGNHEYNTANAAPYWDYFGSTAGPRDLGYYSYDLAGWHVVVLNSNCSKVGGCYAGSVQEQWLKADLEASDAQCTVAVWHHPRFSSTSPGAPDNTYLDFWRDLMDAGVEIVLNGHDHAYERFAPQTPDGEVSQVGIRQFTAGTGGRTEVQASGRDPNSQVRIDDAFGILRLDLGDNGYSWRFIAVDGSAATDSGTDTCH